MAIPTPKNIALLIIGLFAASFGIYTYQYFICHTSYISGFANQYRPDCFFAGKLMYWILEQFYSHGMLLFSAATASVLLLIRRD